MEVFVNENGPANIQLEVNVKLTKKQVAEYGDHFEKAKKVGEEACE